MRLNSNGLFTKSKSLLLTTTTFFLKKKRKNYQFIYVNWLAVIFRKSVFYVSST